MFYDVIRYLDFAMFGVGCAFMLVTNVLAFKVLRTATNSGFLWWHVTTISLSFLCLGTVGVELAFSRLGEGPTWRTPVVFVGILLFMIAQCVIFYVELHRYASRMAADKATVKDL